MLKSQLSVRLTQGCNGTDQIPAEEHSELIKLFTFQPYDTCNDMDQNLLIKQIE